MSAVGRLESSLGPGSLVGNRANKSASEASRASTGEGEGATEAWRHALDAAIP